TPVASIVSKTDCNRIRKKNQVTAKKSATLQDQFRRIDPKSSIDKIHKDLVDALQRASRITKLLEPRVRQEFPGNKNRALVTKTRVSLTQMSWKIDQSIERVKRHMKAMSGVVKDVLPELLDEYLWRLWFFPMGARAEHSMSGICQAICSKV
ncbi:unnamed protein product, partial [Aphanomyces euteiches]